MTDAKPGLKARLKQKFNAAAGNARRKMRAFFWGATLGLVAGGVIMANPEYRDTLEGVRYHAGEIVATIRTQTSHRYHLAALQSHPVRESVDFGSASNASELRMKVEAFRNALQAEGINVYVWAPSVARREFCFTSEHDAARLRALLAAEAAQAPRAIAATPRPGV